MALPLGKLTILIGAGILGSVLSQEGRASKVTELVSGAFKIVFKHVKQDTSQGASRPQNDSLLAQVTDLREELQMLASSRSVTVVSGNGSGGGSIGMPVVIVAGGIIGYGYIWWKGWKLSDMMFATRRSLSDACGTVGKQVDQVRASLSAARRELSKKIEGVDRNVDQCAAINAATRDEVVELSGDLKNFGLDVESVKRAVQTLESKIGRIEGTQDCTNQGVYRLVRFVKDMQSNKKRDGLLTPSSSSSKPALELPNASLTTRTLSLPATPVELEPSTPTSETPRISPSTSWTARVLPADSGLKVLQGISGSTEASDSSSSGGNNGSSPFSRFGWKLNAPFLSRTHSAA